MLNQQLRPIAIAIKNSNLRMIDKLIDLGCEIEREDIDLAESISAGLADKLQKRPIHYY